MLKQSSLELRVKGYTLAQEARILRRLVNRQKRKIKGTKLRRLTEKSTPTYNKLREHLLKVVRPEARACHLARAFLKGFSYERIETIAYSIPPLPRVWYLVNKYAKGDPRDIAQQFEEWQQGAIKHYSENNYPRKAQKFP